MSDAADSRPILREVSPDIADPETIVKREVVEVLERALVRARAGELREVVLMAVAEDGTADGELWFVRTASLSTTQRIGLLETAKYLAMRDWLEENGV